MGKRCETCINGFAGNPRIGKPDDCKPHVPQCGKNQFYGNRAHDRACVPCFCNGLKVECESSSLTYSKIKSVFDKDDEGWKVVDIRYYRTVWPKLFNDLIRQKKRFLIFKYFILSLISRSSKMILLFHTL